MEALDSTKEAAKDPQAIKDILTAASDRAMLKDAKPGACLLGGGGPMLWVIWEPCLLADF